MTIEETSIEDFEWIMGINFWGMVYGSKAFLPQLHKKETTALLNVSSLFGLIGAAYQGAYCATKFGIRGFNECLIAELEGTNIQMHTIHPGGIKTSIALNAKGGDKRYAKAFDSLLALSAEDAAAIIIDAIIKNKARILIGKDAKGGDIVGRIAPIKLINFIQRKIMQKVEREIKKR